MKILGLRTWVLGATLGFAFGFSSMVSPTIAEATWHDALVIKQVKNIGLCLLATGGGITEDVVVGINAVIVSAAKESAKLIVNVSTGLADCLLHTVNEVTPDDDPHV